MLLGLSPPTFSAKNSLKLIERACPLKLIVSKTLSTDCDLLYSFFKGGSSSSDDDSNPKNYFKDELLVSDDIGLSKFKS